MVAPSHNPNTHTWEVPIGPAFCTPPRTQGLHQDEPNPMSGGGREGQPMGHRKAANGPREGSQWAMMPYMHKPTAMASNG